jgi:cytochrome b
MFSIKVWDLPTRFFHWLLVLSFAGAFLSAESERNRDLHVLFGYTVLGLMVFRLIWGFIGSRYARFSSFVYSPKIIYLYFCQLIQNKAQHPIGHNPAGAVVIFLLLLLGIGSGLTGWAVFEDVSTDLLTQLHELISNAMLVMVCIHITGVVISSYLQGENLITAMITGKKQGDVSQAIFSNVVGLAWLLLVMVIGLWIWAWPPTKDLNWLLHILS